MTNTLWLALRDAGKRPAFDVSPGKKAQAIFSLSACAFDLKSNRDRPIRTNIDKSSKPD
jgi:hypothetical protein